MIRPGRHDLTGIVISWNGQPFDDALPSAKAVRKATEPVRIGRFLVRYVGPHLTETAWSVERDGAALAAFSQFRGAWTLAVAFERIELRNDWVKFLIDSQLRERVKRIPLSRGHEALVDSEDFEGLLEWDWYSTPGRRSNYAVRSVNATATTKFYQVRMHAQILGVTDGSDVDHRNGNGLDNRRENLRECTGTENARNRQKDSLPRTSKYKGVSWHKVTEKWAASIRVGGRTVHLGLFVSEDEAAQAYDDGALAAHGEFACLNLSGGRRAI